VEVFLNGVAEFWPLWVLLGAVLVVRALLLVWDWGRLKRSGIEEIDRMDGRTFERRLAILFGRLGYQVEHVGRRGEYGADLIVRRDGKRTVVQASAGRRTSASRQSRRRTQRPLSTAAQARWWLRTAISRRQRASSRARTASCSGIAIAS
jgi:Restriction endonuclease